MKSDCYINFDEPCQDHSRKQMKHVIKTLEDRENINMFNIYVTDIKKAFGPKKIEK